MIGSAWKWSTGQRLHTAVSWKGKRQNFHAEQKANKKSSVFFLSMEIPSKFVQAEKKTKEHKEKNKKKENTKTKRKPRGRRHRRSETWAPPNSEYCLASNTKPVRNPEIPVTHDPGPKNVKPSAFPTHPFP